MTNVLWYGDCLTVMQDMNLGSVDLIYLDPPFNSNRAYNAIYRDATGRPLPDQIDAFCDMWTLDEEREEVIRFMPVLLRQAGVDDSAARLWQLWMNALRGTQPRLLAYLSYMTERLVQMKPLLKPTGTIYLHCDPTASHYIKVIMDAIFRHDNFLNEVVWTYRKWTNTASSFQKNHDIILAYARKKGAHTFNKLFDEDAPQQAKFQRGWDSNVVRGGIRQLIVYDRVKASAKIEHGGYDRIVYRDKQTAVALPDYWAIPILNSQARERIGYATQKPLVLLERIIQASSKEGDTVFDPFCGCATTLEAAHNLGRRWIGIDIAYHAIKHVVMPRLQERLRLYEGTDFVVRGEPRTFDAAQDLWTRDKYHFQSWAISLADGLPTNKRTADGGIDGRLHFASPNVTSEQSMAIEVKGGRNVSIRDLRALRGVLEADEAWMAGLIILHPLGTIKERNFRQFMAQAGQVEVFGMQYPRMQMLSVQELLDGKRFRAPSGVTRGSRQGVLLSPST